MQVSRASREGIAVVSPDWLYACAFRWQRQREADYPPPPLSASATQVSPTTPRPPCRPQRCRCAAVWLGWGGGRCGGVRHGVGWALYVPPPLLYHHLPPYCYAPPPPPYAVPPRMY